MALIEGLLCGMVLFFYAESIRHCFTTRSYQRHEMIPIILHHPSSTGDFVFSHAREPVFNIEHYAPLNSDETNESCSICFEPMNTIRYRRKTICGHTFCSDCLQEWLHKKKSCPLCNRSFTEH